MKTLEGQRILVAGAAGGIGSAVARELAAQGAAVALGDILNDDVAAVLKGLKREISEAGGTAVDCICDVTTSRSCEGAVLQAEKRLDGELTGLAYCAGWVETAGFQEMGADTMLNQVDLHAGGVLRLFQVLQPKWTEERRGSMIVMTSIAGELPAIGKHAYNASKAAATTLCLSLAAEFGPKGIQIVPILANRVGTPSAMERAGRSEEHAAEMASTQLNGAMIPPEHVAEAFAFLFTEAGQSIGGDPFYITNGAKSALAARPKMPQ